MSVDYKIRDVCNLPSPAPNQLRVNTESMSHPTQCVLHFNGTTEGPLYTFRGKGAYITMHQDPYPRVGGDYVKKRQFQGVPWFPGGGYPLGLDYVDAALPVWSNFHFFRWFR